MLIILPLLAIAASSFALGYGVRALISARRKERSHTHHSVASYGMKQRIEIPVGSAIGQTTACPTRFGSATSASSGTSIH